MSSEHQISHEHITNNENAGFTDDKNRINVEEHFKRLLPETKVSVI